MSLPPRTFPAGFISPCLPTNAPQPPSGELWLHEIKHDGFRVIARKEDRRVKLYSRPGNDLTDRFSLIVEALAKVRSRSCIIDGEAVACGGDGISSFDLIRYRQHDASVFMFAFDLIELAALTCGGSPWRCARRHSPACSRARHRGCASMSTLTMKTARSCSRTPAGWGSRASCRNGAARPTARDGRRTGSSRRTRTRRQ